MSHFTIFYSLVALGVYSLVVVWRREAQANGLVVPIFLATAQALFVVASTYLSADPASGPSTDALIGVYWKGLLPLTLVQMFLLPRRKPDVYSRINISWPLSLIVGRQGWPWFMILVMAQLAIALASLSTWQTADIAVLVLHVATIASMVLIQLGRLGPRPPDPIAQTFE